MSENVLMVERDGYIATLTINRPDQRNALNPEIHAGLVRHIDRFASEGEVRCLVIRGMGERAFSAGDDLKRDPNDPGPAIDPGVPEAMQWPMRRSRQAIFDAPFPVIAMIRGYCVGGGLALASECDFRIASDDSQLGIPPSKLGIIYDYERIQVFTELVGPSFTKELFCLGRRVSAERALMMGLVNEVVPASRLHETVYGMAQEFASNAPLSVRGHKRIVNTLTRRGFEGSALSQHDIDEIHEMQRIARASEDAQEGPRAFREKRTPVFTGR